MHQNSNNNNASYSADSSPYLRCPSHLPYRGHVRRHCLHPPPTCLLAVQHLTPALRHQPRYHDRLPSSLRLFQCTAIRKAGSRRKCYNGPNLSWARVHHKFPARVSGFIFSPRHPRCSYYALFPLFLYCSCLCSCPCQSHFHAMALMILWLLLCSISARIFAAPNTATFVLEPASRYAPSASTSAPEPTGNNINVVELSDGFDVRISNEKLQRFKEIARSECNSDQVQTPECQTAVSQVFSDEDKEVIADRLLLPLAKTGLEGRGLTGVDAVVVILIAVILQRILQDQNSGPSFHIPSNTGEKAAEFQDFPVVLDIKTATGGPNFVIITASAKPLASTAGPTPFLSTKTTS
ncbi:hypothetical protein K402DRAFT_203454 [Aulographum hederae CBS 113979]|uniref:Uncharacterized protein n=1 Tax=Aulographum hederae CBS 113979 TaxID=1176131 RepID=A0A6G1HC14_9PEZI|nr:hypothetical protein K402DRAFT_203454 [Aulographum hederae CBS 113979]